MTFQVVHFVFFVARRGTTTRHEARGIDITFTIDDQAHNTTLYVDSEHGIAQGTPPSKKDSSKTDA
jgi:hypothetical protein